MSIYRPDLPKVPFRLRARPIRRGYPVPWFVAKVDGDYDFRIVDARKFAPAVRRRLCWICGQGLGNNLAFLLGPMCAINRTIGDPPSHRECAEWAAQACPFLNQRESHRRTGGMPEEARVSEFAIERQPGVTLLWVTRSCRVFQAPDATPLWTVGDPIHLAWYCQGRPATRADVLASIESGYPTLLRVAEQEGPAAVQELEAARDRTMALLPCEVA